MRGSCSTHCKWEMPTKLYVGKYRTDNRVKMGDPIKCDLGQEVCIWLQQLVVEHGTETSGSRKSGDLLTTWQLLGTFTVMKSAHELSHFRPPVRMYQSGPHWTDFLEIWCLGPLWKSVEKIQTWLQLGKNSRHFTWISKYVVLLSDTLIPPSQSTFFSRRPEATTKSNSGN